MILLLIPAIDSWFEARNIKLLPCPLGEDMKTVHASLTLLTTAEGGRHLPIMSVRDFSCPVFFEDVPALAKHGYDCRLLVGRLRSEIYLGETVQDIQIAFLSPDDVLPHIRSGTRFYLWEGRRIGVGEVTSVNG